MSNGTEVFVVIDVGCHECGTPSEPVGIFANQPDAEAAAARTNAHTNGWREGGQTIAEVFKMAVPA